MIDGVDRKILTILLQDAATSKAEIARRVGLVASAVSERVRRLQAEGVIRATTVSLDARKLGKPLLAFVFVTDAKPSRGFDTAAALSRVTGLEELHKIAGDDCYLMKIRAADPDELNQIIENEINTVQSVTRVRTTIVLNSVAERPAMAGHSLEQNAQNEPRSTS